ncbi:MAG TPA: GldG family protein [Methylomirabilota bacterium]|nr:GldG family protein [Methylomirabilota bacterium]
MPGAAGAGLMLLAGLALLAAALLGHAVLLEATIWTVALALAGAVLAGGGAYVLRAELTAMVRGRRGEIAAYTLGLVGVTLVVAHVSTRYPARFDLTESGRYSLSEPTVTMLKRLEKPVHVVFFHDPMMRETVELYELMARQTPRLTVEFHDPMLNPAQARMLGVNFAGTAVLRSEGRTLQVNSPGETDIANGILRVSQSATQRLCFLDGHGEPDPFSMESHDHMEGAPGHSHGLGVKYVLHERHGMAKARHALETLNYDVRKVSLLQGGGDILRGCAVLVVAGPKLALLPPEIAAVRAFLADGGNALFMLDPFVASGLESLLRDYGIVVMDDIVIDEASHFWTDVSAPAVTDYNRHQITRDLPLSFFPGARSLAPTPQRPPGSSAIPLVNSSRRSWGQTNRTRIEQTAESGRGPLTLMVVAQRRPVTPGEPDPFRREAPLSVDPVRRSSRIAVVGDSDFATNSFFPIMGNGALFLNTVNYLAAQENLIGLQPRAQELPRVNLTNRQMKATFVLSVVLVPAVLAVVGTAVWWRQR